MGLAIGAVRVVVICFIGIALAVSAVALRLWSRYIQRVPLALHDWITIVALILALGSTSINMASSFNAGIGHHLQDLMVNEPDKFFLFFKLFVAGQIMWAAANTCVKFSILSLYMVLFPGRRFSQICYATMALTTAYLISVILEALVLCQPVQYSWDKSIPDGTCKGENIAYLVAGITNLVIDAWVVVLPMPKLFSLQMSLAKKLSIASMFGLGALICILSLLRVIWIGQWDLDDVTYTVISVQIYTVLEPTLGIVNTCLPTIKPAILAIGGRKPSQLNPPPKYSGSAWLSSHKGSGVPSSNRRKLHGHEIDTALTGTQDFERLDDDVPLTDIIVRGGPGQETSGNGAAITVEREWVVDRENNNLRGQC